jgi:hypothetical protein
MRLIVAAVLAVLAVPAYAGGLCYRASGGGLPPLYGGGFTPLDCAATVFPAPRRCRCSVSPRVVSITRRPRATHRVWRKPACAAKTLDLTRKRTCGPPVLRRN